MQAVIAILAALVHRAATGEGATLDVSVADGVVALMSLYVDEYLATGEVPGPATTSSPAATRVTTCTAAPTTAGSRSPRSSRTSSRTCAARSAASSGSRTRPTTRCRTRCAPTSAPRSRAGRATSGSPSSARPTPACRRSRRVPELVGARALPRARRVHARDRARARRLRAGGLGARRAWTATQPGPTVRDATVTDTDALLREAGYSAAEIAALREEGVAA